MPPPPDAAGKRPQDDDLPPDEESADESAEDDEDAEQEEGEKVEGPPEESFDEKYNKHLEFPISLVGAVFAHVALAAMLVLALVYLPSDDKSGVPVKLVNLEGLDEFGEGSAGSGGVEDPFIKADGNPDQAAERQLEEPNKLPDVQDVKEALKLLDQTGNMPASPSNVKAYADLDKRIRDKIMGQKQGAGPGKGSGYDGTAGTGPGGTGSDSTLGRNMRWVLRFKVESGRNYLEQLRALKAEILVPIPDSDKAYLIRDLTNWEQHQLATDDDMRRLGGKIKFADSRPAAVNQVAQTLRLDFKPKQFWAFFPKDIEKELSERELNYRNRRSEDIEETKFSVRVNGNDYKFVVDEQTVKK